MSTRPPHTNDLAMMGHEVSAVEAPFRRILKTFLLLGYFDHHRAQDVLSCACGRS